jgi:hypothetical protein
MNVPQPEDDGDGYDLQVQLFIDGFDVGPGERLTHAVRVTQANPFPTETVNLTARPIQGDAADRVISATFSIDNEVLGVAYRVVRVAKEVAAQPVARTARTAPGANITAPTGEPPAHVTVTIQKGAEQGVLQWGIVSRLDRIGLPTDRMVTSAIGQDAKVFAVDIIKKLFALGSKDGLYEELRGIGLTIADRMPPEVVDALRSAAAAVAPDQLQVLLLTQEPYVPWELALLEEPFDDAVSPFLGAQANVGRWILDPNKRTNPITAVRAGSMAVVSGVYQIATLGRLEAAEQEAKDLTAAYAATPVSAERPLVSKLLRGDPPADILHFAVHGRYDPQGAGEGLYMIDGDKIDPFQIRGSNLKAQNPFVFLNACQVGASAEVLEGYSGIAEAFLRAGACAVVAPLWSIDDKIAHAIALSFYSETLAAPANAGAAHPPPVADLLRRARANFSEGQADLSATYLAYQFYGHPTMRLSWDAAPGGPTSG